MLIKTIFLFTVMSGISKRTLIRGEGRNFVLCRGFYNVIRKKNLPYVLAKIVVIQETLEMVVDILSLVQNLRQILINERGGCLVGRWCIHD